MIFIKEEDYKNLNIPSYQELMDYLESIESNFAKVDFSGTSLKGLRVPYIEIGHGEKAIGITGGAHSDEPVGIATCKLVIKSLLENEENKNLLSEFKFCIHPCLDVDGALLNYPWANSEDYITYLTKNFRNNNPAMDVEHGIPANSEQNVRPELKFFMENLSKYKGEMQLYITLHTTHSLAGALVLLFSRSNTETLIKTFSGLARELKVELDDYKPKPDEGLEYIAPGFLKSPSFDDFKKNFESQPEVLKNYKYTTYEWAHSELNCPICLIAEFPFNLDRTFNNHAETITPLEKYKKEENLRNLKNYDVYCEALSLIEEFPIDKENPWYKRACLYRDYAKQSYDKSENFYDQFKGIMATEADIYETELIKIEEKLKTPSLKICLLENIPEAELIVKQAREEIQEVGKEWLEASRGFLLSNSIQSKLQTALINSGLQELVGGR